MVELDALFRPTEGQSVIRAPGCGSGWWAGAPGAAVHSSSGDIYLSYRLRHPRGAERERGFCCIIGRSSDGLKFQPVCEITKEELETSSLERSALLEYPDGGWALFMSYVDAKTGAWRTDVLEADRPEEFRASSRKSLFLPQKLGLSAVKDPVVVKAGAAWLMYLSVASPRTAASAADHSTQDVFDTGTILSHTSLATSFNGRSFTYQGLVLEADDRGSWDSYSRRIASIVPSGGRWLAFYDGARGVENHYDETTGLAVSTDLKSWRRLSADGPALQGPGGSCLRYVDAVRRDDAYFFYYEYGLPDGSHELRLNKAPAASVESLL